MDNNVIEVFADIVCPFTHVGLRRLAERRNELGRDEVKLLIRALPLEVINGEPMDPAAVATKVADLRDQVSPDLFSGFDQSQFPASSLPALALTNAAYRKDLATGEAVALHLRSLLFDQGRDVLDPEVLGEVADRFGLEIDAARDDAAVLTDLEESRERGVVGSPHFFTPAGDSLFCPTLELSKSGDHFDVSIDIDRFEELVGSCFSPTGGR